MTVDRRSFLAGLGAAAAWAAPLRQGERDRALSALHATRKQYTDTLAGVSAAQWEWKPAADRWSVGEVAEHLALSEETLFQLIETKILSSPAQPEKMAETKGKDETVLKLVSSREQKFQAPEFLQPRKAFPDKAATVAAFVKARDRNIAFIRETNADMREHIAPHPALGPLDAYQWFLLIAAHTERHLAQVKEVMATEGYPKA
jgi:hypothetical protein